MCLLWATCVRKRGDRFAAHEPVAQAVNRGIGVSAPDAADGVELRHDHSSQYLTDYSQDRTFQWLQSHFAFLGEPETNGFVERFNRTLKKQIIYGRTYRNCDKFAAVVATFIET